MSNEAQQPATGTPLGAVACSALIPVVMGKPMRWRKRIHGLYARNGDLLTMRTADQLIEELQDAIIAMQKPEVCDCRGKTQPTDTDAK